MSGAAFLALPAWRDLFRVAALGSAPEKVFLVIEILVAASCAAGVDRLVDHHLREELGVAADASRIESRFVSTEKPGTSGRRVYLVLGQLTNSSELGIRSLARLQVVTDVTAWAAFADGNLALVFEIGHIVIAASGHLP